MKINPPRTRLSASMRVIFILTLLALSLSGVQAAYAQGGKRPRSNRAVPVMQAVAPAPRMTLSEMIEVAAAEAGISRHLLASLVHQESGGKWWAVSHKGARGLGQLMPGTAARFGVRNVFDPMQNLRGSARYMRWLLDRYQGDVKLALAGYNAGEGAVDRYGRRIPPYRETQNYVASIYPRFVASASSGQTQPRLKLTSQPLRNPTVAQGGERPSGQPGPPDVKQAASDNQPAPEEGNRQATASVYFFRPAAAVSPSVLPK